MSALLGFKLQTTLCTFLVLVVPSCLYDIYFCGQRGAFWAQMYLAVRTQWTTPLISMSIKYSNPITITYNADIMIYQNVQCVDPALVQLWVNIAYAGPQLGQHKANVLFLV